MKIVSQKVPPKEQEAKEITQVPPKEQEATNSPSPLKPIHAQ
jgi:hypothetical protein